VTAAEKTLVMYGEGVREAARRMLPKLPDERFVPIEQERLREAVKEGLVQVIMVARMGEQAAFLGGAAGLLESITLDMDCGPVLAEKVAQAPAVRDVYDLWEATGKLGPCGRELCRRTAGELERRTADMAGSSDAQVAAQVVLLDAMGENMVGMYGRMAR
jgi:cobalt-precorrin-5B (C1)-methyltransferase